MVHEPVLLGEAIGNLNIKPGDTVVDGTLGAGGHSGEILKKILPNGRLISIDRDEKAIENFRKIILKSRQVRICPAPINNNTNSEKNFPENNKIGNRGENIAEYWCGVSDNYANLKEILAGLGISAADAVLVDLGFSSDQIEDPERGFSFQKDGPLDMRYSPAAQESTAAGVVNGYSERELARIFKIYGEEKFARRIAGAIAEYRKERKIGRTKELVEIIGSAVPQKYRNSRIHFATRVFQALRMEVNQELPNLKSFLDQAKDVLASGGRLAVISFHSLEDRIVKEFFRLHSKDCVCPPNFPKCVCKHRKTLEIITRKPIQAGDSEISANPRARSAKLRVAEKI
ncbi:MAG: 16S rRNA (cytosine(1402)-N(4))-methyltransferase RsmH [Parcubacteria group bacterium]|jgi:16S rRNA (cytosine1402-N4)-methyltransferase